MKNGIKSIEDWEKMRPSFHKAPYSFSAYKAWAVIVFAKLNDEYILADIPGRGLTVPSGRIEEGESPDEAAVRETWEEIGARIKPEELKYMGYYLVRAESGDHATVPTYFVKLTQYGEVPEGSESLGALPCRHENLKARYWMWDKLIERVFAIAEEYTQDNEDYAS